MTLRSALLLALIFFAIQAVILILLGQPIVCECGAIKLWEGQVLSSGNSQHLMDWYSPSHIIHGFAFFFLLTWLFPRMPVAARFALAVGMEGVWEVIENTPMVIDHYRQQALAQGYIGDSVINSLSDTFMAALGFIAASRLPWWAVVLIAILLECFTIYMIRDGLLFNIIGFVAPNLLGAWQAQ